MTRLIDEVGPYRHGGIGVMSGDRDGHMALSANQVYRLMEGLLQWLAKCNKHPLIQSLVFHYEFEFILQMILDAILSSDASDQDIP